MKKKASPNRIQGAIFMEKICVSSVLAKSSDASCQAKIGDCVLVNVQDGFYSWGLIKSILITGESQLAHVLSQ